MIPTSALIQLLTPWIVRADGTLRVAADRPIDIECIRLDLNVSLEHKVRETYWTQGPFDGLIIFDAPDEETAAALILDLNSLGNVETQTGRAFNAAEIEQVLSKIE